MKVKCYKVAPIKSLGKDENGIERMLWATESQYKEIIKRMNDPELRNSAVTIGPCSIPISRIDHIECKTKERYDLPSYFLERHDNDNRGLKTNQKPWLDNINV